LIDEGLEQLLDWFEVVVVCAADDVWIWVSGVGGRFRGHCCTVRGIVGTGDCGCECGKNQPAWQFAPIGEREAATRAERFNGIERNSVVYVLP